VDNGHCPLDDVHGVLGKKWRWKEGKRDRREGAKEGVDGGEEEGGWGAVDVTDRSVTGPPRHRRLSFCVGIIDHPQCKFICQLISTPSLVWLLQAKAAPRFPFLSRSLTHFFSRCALR